MTWSCTDPAYRKDGDEMTWTCQCDSVTNNDGDKTCSNCCSPKPDGLSEEERAALAAYNVGRTECGWLPAPYALLGVAHMISVVAQYRAARAPLEVENAKLRATIAGLERQRDGHQQAAGAAGAAAERARELENQVDQFCDAIHMLERDKDRRIASLQSDLTYAAELLGAADQTAKAANLETAVGLLKRLARDESSIVREGAERGLENIQAQKPAASQPRRYPADRMSPRELEDTLWNEFLKGTYQPENIRAIVGARSKVLAKARELFTPCEPAKDERKVPKKGDPISILDRYGAKVIGAPTAEHGDFVARDEYGAEFVLKQSDLGKSWFFADSPSAKGAE